VACSRRCTRETETERGGVEVVDTTMRSTMMGLRKRMATVCSGSRMRRQSALRPGMRQQRASGPGSRMVGGGTTMSRMIEEQEHLAVSKNY
jgi:hypothetical protein